ncbi:MAG: ribokinase [Candidatus Promineifilaceae bacterium]|nr:ribokinase [Candidatus Promineifilaceae bacterium]
MANRVVVVGSINMDLVTRTDKIPEPGETVLGGDLTTFPGGKGANQAVAAARMGAKVAMIGHVGNDLFAEQLQAGLAADNIDHRFVTNKSVASGVALIVVDASGQNSIVVAPGANSRLSPADVESAITVIKSGDVMLLQLEVPLESILRAAQLAKDNGVLVILNPAPVQTLSPELLALVDVLIPNESEAAVLSGMTVGDEEGLKSAAREIHALGVGTIVFTLGERGAFLSDGDLFSYFPAYPIEQVVDTTAAGDSFVGGFAVALAEGKSLETAILWGCAAGALAVMRTGAQPSIPTRAEVESLLESNQE